MNIRPFITLFALLLCFTVSAQNVPDRAAKRAKQRAENRAQNKVDRSVDKAVDDAFNSIGNLFKKKKKKQAPAPSGSTKTTDEANKTNEKAGTDGSGGLFGAILGGGKNWEPYTNPFAFSITMEMEETKRSGKVDKSSIRLGVTSDRFAIRIADGAGNENSHMILNTQNGMTTMITTDKRGEKTGVQLRIPAMGGTVTETGEETLDRYTFEKTGEWKVVDGYNCEKVVVTDTEKGTVTEAWVTQDLDITSVEIFSGMARAFGGKAPRARGGAAKAPFEGFPIMSTTVENGKTYVTRFRDIKIGEANMDKSLLNTSGVEIQRLGF